MKKENLEFYESLTNRQCDLLKKYFQKRYENIKQESRISIVFDLLHYCNLNCVGCGTSALKLSSRQDDQEWLTEEDILTILYKIKEYSISEKKDVFIFFGGGEPFLRKDIKRILKTAASLFGEKNIGIDSNGSLDNSFELLSEVADYLSYIGISINGLHDYHNWWSNNYEIDAYEKSMSTVKSLCLNSGIRSKLEVTSVATTRNIESLIVLMSKLKAIGVENYSVHRAFPVGRMANLSREMIPSWRQYLMLLCNILETGEYLGMDVHLHHSIESIHATLLCGYNTITDDNLIDKNSRSSIAIDHKGNLLINPWSTAGFWDLLILGNLLGNSLSVKDLLLKNNTLIESINNSYSSNIRCNGCAELCSGGSRIIAATTMLQNKKQVDFNTLMHALRQIDPACPLYDKLIFN